jgi:hypothetical protein
MTKAYVVTYQAYRYGDPGCYRHESDHEYLLEENFYVKGVFSTNQAAKRFVKEDAMEFAEEKEIKHLEEWHYSILEHNILGGPKE